MDEIKLGDYRADVEKLLVYLPWLESKVGVDTSRTFNERGLEQTSLTFPVYESTLINFVNEASKTKLMNPNYAYVYSRNFIKTTEDEKKAIENAGVTNYDILLGILSKYVLGGMTKGVIWSQGVHEGIYVLVLKKFKKLLEIWDAPLA